jgi:hypothetical protein
MTCRFEHGWDMGCFVGGGNEDAEIDRSCSDGRPILRGIFVSGMSFLKWNGLLLIIDEREEQDES